MNWTGFCRYRAHVAGLTWRRIDATVRRVSSVFGGYLADQVVRNLG